MTGCVNWAPSVEEIEGMVHGDALVKAAGSILRAMTARRPAAGLPYRKVHALRHSFATWGLEGDHTNGLPAENILRVRDWMDHASVEETERYAHVNSMGATAALDALSELVSRHGNS
jgi:integrase